MFPAWLAPVSARLVAHGGGTLQHLLRDQVGKGSCFRTADLHLFSHLALDIGGDLPHIYCPIWHIGVAFFFVGGSNC